MLCVGSGGSIACHTWPCTVRGVALAALLREGYCIAEEVFWPVWQMVGNKISLHLCSEAVLAAK